jgi:hypothetical protein
MDGFCAAEASMELLVSLLLAMVQDADAGRRAHAFSLLLNTTLHALLAADITTARHSIGGLVSRGWADSDG